MARPRRFLNLFETVEYDDEMSNLGISDLGSQVADAATKAGWDVEEVFRYDNGGHHSTDEADEFELRMKDGAHFYIAVDMDGNVVWWDFKRKDLLGNLKNPQGLVTAFRYLRDEGETGGEIRSDQW